MHSPPKTEDKEQSGDHFAVSYMPLQNIAENQIMVPPLSKSDVLKKSEEVVHSFKAQLEKNELYLQQVVSSSTHSRTPEDYTQSKKGGNRCICSNHLKAGMQSVVYKSRTYNAEQHKPVCKTMLDTSFPKDGYMCPNNSFIDISTYHSTIVKPERESNQEYQTETAQRITENMILDKECDSLPKVCECQQSDHDSEQFMTKLSQSIVKEKTSTESEENHVGVAQFQNTGKISVETNTEPGIPFRNTPNTAIFNVKVQQTSTRTDEKKFSPRNNLQKTLQRQELPSVNIRPELCIQFGPTIHISSKCSKNSKQLRRNIDVTNINCDEVNMNATKQAVNDEGYRFLMKNNTKELEEAEKLKSHVKVKSRTQPNEDLLTKHEKFKYFVETFITRLQRENSKIDKNQNKKLLQTLQSLSSNINELYANFQYAVPSYQDCIMTRIDRVTQLLEYELQDEDSITNEHRCRLDEFFQQLTKSFQQEQCRRLWQKNVSVPPQDFVTFKSSLKCRNNLGRQEQINLTDRPFQKKTTVQSVTNLNRNKQLVNDKTGKHLHYMNSTGNSESKKPNIIKNMQHPSDFSLASRSQVSKQVSFGKNIQKFVSDRRKQLALKNSMKKDTIQSVQVIAKQSISETNNDITKVNSSNLQKPSVSEHISNTAESWQAERMRAIQKIHEQLSELELQFEHDNNSKSFKDSSPINITSESSVTNVEVSHSRLTEERDSEIETTGMDTTQNKSQLDEANEDVEVQYADDWEVDDDGYDDDDDDDDADESHDKYDEGNSHNNIEVSCKGIKSNDDGIIETGHINKNDDGGDDDDSNNNDNSNKGSTDQDYVQCSFNLKNSGKSDALLSNEDRSEGCVPLEVTSMSVSVKKSQEDKEDDMLKINSNGLTVLTECEIIADYSSALPIKPGIDVNKVDLNDKVSDIIKDSADTESSVMKESGIVMTSEICIQTDIQNDCGNRNISTQIDINDCSTEFKNITNGKGKLSAAHENDNILCNSSNKQSHDCCCSSIVCESINRVRIEKCTQTKTEYSDGPMQSVTLDSAETVYEVSMRDCQTENAFILKTSGKNQNIQFVVNVPNESGNRQITNSRQFISEKDITNSNNLTTTETNLQGPSTLAVHGLQKPDTIKDVVESTVEQVLKKYNDSMTCTHLLKNESVHSNSNTENKTVKFADENLSTKVESERENLFDLTVPNISLETNTEFWTKLREAAEFFTNVASRHTEASHDNPVIHSDNRTDDRTALQDIKLEAKEILVNGNSKKPKSACTTDQNKRQHNNIETKSITNLTNSKHDSTLSSGSSVGTTSSSSSSFGVLKTRKCYRDNKNSLVKPVLAVSEGEICLTSSMCSCSVGEVKSLYCQYCEANKFDTSHSEDLSIGELKKRSTVNRHKKYYYGGKLIGKDDWNLSSKVDMDSAHMSLVGGNMIQHIQASTDDTSTSSEGEIKYAAEVVTLEEYKEIGRQMKLQSARYQSLSQASHSNGLNQLNYGSAHSNKCNIKRLHTDHNKNKEKYDVSVVNNESLYKYRSGPKTNIHSGSKSTSKSFAEVAKRIIEELKKEKMLSLQTYNTTENDISFRNKENKIEIMDPRQLDKHDNLLQNVEPTFGIVTTHDTIIPLKVKEVWNTGRNMKNSVSDSYIEDNSMKDCLTFQYSEDCTSNKIEEIYEDNEIVQAKRNFSTREKSIYSSNFKSTVGTTTQYIRKQHTDLSETRSANIEGNHSNWKLSNSSVKQTSADVYKLNKTDDVRTSTSTEDSLGEWFKSNIEPKEMLSETYDPQKCDIQNSSCPEDDVQQIPLQLDTAESENLVTNFENVNSCIEVFTESKDISEPSTIGLHKDSSSSTSYDDLPGIYEIDFDSESKSKSSGEVVPGIATVLDTMYYTEYESDSNCEVDKSEGHIKDEGP